jgi:hypothetical protein
MGKKKNENVALAPIYFTKRKASISSNGKRSDARDRQQPMHFSDCRLEIKIHCLKGGSLTLTRSLFLNDDRIHQSSRKQERFFFQ